MKVKVKAFGLLQEQIGGSGWKVYEIERGSTIQKLLEILELDKNSVMNIVKNGEILTLDYEIQDNDELKILPHIHGG